MIELRHMVLGSLIVLLFLLACQTPPPPPPPQVTPGQCEVAIVILFDTSGSMAIDIGSGQSLLDLLKQSATSVVQVIPADQWNMGLATFPTTGGPNWGMEVLTNMNRQALIDAINALSASGISPMDAGLTLGGLMLATDQVRPRFLVVFSDGRVCGNDCSTVLNTASYLKSELGIFITTVGYNLSGNDYNTMLDVASLQPDGTHAFLNAGTAAEVIDFMENSLGILCDRLEVAIDTDRAGYVTGQGGSDTGQYNVKYLQGDSRTVRVIPEGPFINGGGSVVLFTQTGTLSDASPSFGDKFEVRSATGMSGDYELRLRVVPDGGDITLATKTVQVSVVPIDFSVTFEGNVVFNQTTNKLEGRVRIDIDTAREVELSVNYRVTAAGSQVEATGFTYPLPPSPLVPVGQSSLPIQFAIERTGAATGLYDVHVIVTALGVQKSRVFSDISIP